ncbi:LacI family DNA-binding transcriptional regulator [Streptomyces sp. NPDC003717]|uniref:LacI family DNA-binding transcriptional regulator n=1 Tax=Streptomyces sp. NPDC003717 TaxID=3154276 RepID=UPI0033A08EFF
MGSEPTRPPAVTSADVARLAGVSRATVSFVLNNTELSRVSAATRERVRRAADELGYVPHAAARSLRAGRSNLVLMPASVSALGSLVSAWVDDLHGELERRGCTSVLHAGRYPDGTSAARAWAELRPVAVLALEGVDPVAAAILHRAGVRAVVALAGHPTEGVHLVPFDHARIGTLAAGHLLARGRRRIGVVMPRERGLATFAGPRLEGAREAVPSGEGEVVPLDMAYTGDSAAEVARQVGALGLDGVFAYNDEYATLLLHALRAQGTDVPGTVAVMGCDDLVPSALQSPSLTSIRLDGPTPARVAELVSSLIEGAAPPEVGGVEPALVVRGSTGTPRD